MSTPSGTLSTRLTRTTAIQRAIGISNCTNLRSVVLYDENPTSPAIVGFLTEASSLQLRSITLKISVRTAVGEAFPNLSILEEPLRSSMPGLQEFCVKYTGDMDMQVVRAEAQRSLTSVHARGILRVIRWVQTL